jgi:dihydropteroate synthase
MTAICLKLRAALLLILPSYIKSLITNIVNNRLIMNSLKIGDQLLELSKPVVMGILNITEDSFYDGGRYLSIDQSIDQAKIMIEEGADIIDIGAASSRPNAPRIEPQIEIDRLLPVITELSKQFPDIILSVDTFHTSVLRSLSQKHAFIVNDITCGQIDKELQNEVASLGFPYVAMHMQGTPQDMQDDPHYDNVIKDILDYLSKSVRSIRDIGIDQIIVDPGFGFGKSIQHNYDLLRSLDVFSLLDSPIMVGLSRKSMIYRVLKSSPAESLNGTTALHMMALSKGAKLLRVHDVKAAVETITLWQQLNQVS